MSKQTRFQIGLGLLIILVIALFAVPVFMIRDGKAPAAGTSTSGPGDELPVQAYSGQNKNITNPTQVDTHSAILPMNKANPDSETATSSTSQSLSYVPKSYLDGNWVVIDCQARIVLQCPHKLISSGQTPDFPASASSRIYKGHCRDLSIQIESFCPN